jgi:hypothetical protein
MTFITDGGDVETPSAEPATDDIIAAYVRIRDSRAKAKKEFEEKDADLAAQLDIVANKLLSICNAQGADSIKTKAGTAMRAVKSRFWTNDWASMYEFIAEHEAFGLLEKRLHQTNFKQFLEENPDLKPVGLNVDNEYVITVRRGK